MRLTYLFLITLFGISSAVASLENPIVAKAQSVGFTHGQLVLSSGGYIVAVSDPENATHTHVGLDIQAPIGSPIMPLTDGVVAKVVNKSAKCKDDKGNSIKPQPEWCYLGYMVMIKHDAGADKSFYTTYLHMNNPPRVKVGEQVVRNTPIGYVGRTGAADGPHVHFEIRLFPEAVYKDWGNIYGPGDQREKSAFKENWLDPQRVFANFPSSINPGISADNGTSAQPVLINTTAVSGVFQLLGTLMVMLSGLALMLSFLGGRRLAGKLFTYGIVFVVIATFIPSLGNAFLSQVLGFVYQLPWWATAIIGGLLTISVLQGFVSLFIGRQGANAFAGQMAAQLFIGLFRLLTAPIRFLRQLL